MDGERVFGWSAALAYITACVVVISGPAEAHQFFCGGDEFCLRNWLSVGGSWFGGLATLVTVVYLAQQLIAAKGQIEEARHEANDQRRSLVQRVINASRSARRSVEGLREEAVTLTESNNPTDDQIAAYVAAASIALTKFRSPAFDEAEFVCPVQILTIKTIRDSLEVHTATAQAGRGTKDYNERVSRLASDSRRYELAYLDELDRLIQAFSDRLR